MLTSFIKNGIYIHFLYALLQHMFANIYLSSAIAIKLYSINYFYWYGHVYTYLPNPRHNWVKQFVRFTDTGHIASFLIIFSSSAVPISHNIQFIIMSGYWVGKIAFNLKDADRISNDKTNKETCDIIDVHTDFCTYVHHTIPYLVVLYKMFEMITNNTNNTNTTTNTNKYSCDDAFNHVTLQYTYAWLYVWFACIYVPWRLYTKDAVYSILDADQTPKTVIAGFIGFMHVLVYVSNVVGHRVCNYF